MWKILKAVFRFFFHKSPRVNCCKCLYWTSVSGYPCDECNGTGSHFEFIGGDELGLDD